MTNKGFEAAMERRNKADTAVIEALNHLPRTHAMSIILSYIPVAELEEVLPTIKGSEPPITEPVEAVLHRFRMESIRRGVALLVRKTRNDPSNAGKSPNLILDEILREVLT